MSRMLKPDIVKCKVEWHLENKRLFVHAMLEVLRKSGTSCESGFKSAQWTEILNIFSRSSGSKYDKQQLQSQHAEMKKKHSRFKAIVENSDFGWDSESKMPTASVATWDAYLMEHPQSKIFRNEPLHLYEESKELFDVKAVTGLFTLSKSTIAASTLISEEKKAEIDQIIEKESSVSSKVSTATSSSKKKYQPDSHSDNKEDDSQTVPVVKIGKKIKKNPEDELVITLNRLVDIVEGKGRMPSPTVITEATDPLSKAIRIFSEEHSSGLSPECSMLLKVFWFENPVHGSLFLSLNNDERIAYVKARVRILKEKISL